MTRIIQGDCLEVMPTMPENSVDSVICDPPYGLDFMGKSWDHGVPGVEFWKAALRVAKPGAILLAFGGTRTFHRLACAIEDAGWELRDTMMFLYGSGFPKSLDISKAIDKAAGAEREVVGKDSRPAYDSAYAKWDKPYEKRSKHFGQGEWDITSPSSIAAHLWQGYGTALKPAWEPIIVAMKPLEGTYAENAQKWGVAGLNIDGGRIGIDAGERETIDNRSGGQISDNTGKWQGPGIARKIGELYRSAPLGRWPANLLLDEEAARLLDEQSGESKGPESHKPRSVGGIWGNGSRIGDAEPNYADHGGASRFFKVCEQDNICPICGGQKGVSWETSSGNLSVSNVDERLRTIQATAGSIVLSDALMTLAARYAPNVKSAGNLCDSCATSIAVALAGIKTSGFNRETLRAILAYTGESTCSILIQNLVPFAALLANTDTIPTIESLSILFGSVNHAITNCTPETKRSEPSRFVYTSKASSSERNAGLEDMEDVVMPATYGDIGPMEGNSRKVDTGHVQSVHNIHPTVKPVSLMRYLCKLTRTPTGGVVLDPFMGSGTTGIACVLEHRDFIGIEIDPAYAEIARKRIADMTGPLFIPPEVKHGDFHLYN